MSDKKQEVLTRPYRYQALARFPLLLSLGASAALLYAVLVWWSSHDVRDSSLYTFFYLVMGAGWLGLSRHLLHYLNLSMRDDVLERSNAASGVACAGALFGLMACFAGGNVGDGPGWWVVIYSAALSTASAAFAWIILDRSTQVSDSITIDRDMGAGLRAGGFWIGSGFIWGRAVAGNWVSYDTTNRDFISYGWPVLCLLAFAFAIEQITRPSKTFAAAPLVFRGVFPALAYIAAGLACVLIFGKP